MPAIFPERAEEYHRLEAIYQAQIEKITRKQGDSREPETQFPSTTLGLDEIFLSQPALRYIGEGLVAKMNEAGERPAVEIAYALAHCGEMVAEGAIRGNIDILSDEEAQRFYEACHAHVQQCGEMLPPAARDDITKEVDQMLSEIDQEDEAIGKMIEEID